MKNPSISVFFPCYKDEGTIKQMVCTARSVLKELADDYEVIVVDDASPDNAGKIADSLARRYKEVRVIHHSRNRGYGGALKSGFAAAKKELIFYTDGDAQYDVRELRKFLPYIKNYDVVTAYKIKRADGFHRLLISKIYYSILKMFFNVHIRDVSGDFRLFRSKVFDKISLESDSGTICIEMMKKVQDAGFRIKELPVRHYPRRHGESAYFNIFDISKTFFELVPLWWKLTIKDKFKKR